MHNLVIAIRSTINDQNKYYSQVLTEECLCKLIK